MYSKMGTKGDNGVAPIFLHRPWRESVHPRETQGQNATKAGINMLLEVMMQRPGLRYLVPVEECVGKVPKGQRVDFSKKLPLSGME